MHQMSMKISSSLLGEKWIIVAIKKLEHQDVKNPTSQLMPALSNYQER